ncbi:MAG: carboxypeptidase regulatory-like domain-containing protein [Pyrinomonadaceae bacterium]
MRTTSIIIRLSLMFLVLSLPALAQTGSTGALTGTVSDSTGAVVAGAQVKVTNAATGEDRTVVSRDNGDYTIPLLLPGSYRIEFSATGFKLAVKPVLQINVTETARFDVQLEVGNVQEQVTVTSEAALLQTESSTLGTVANSRAVSNLPLVNRNYTQIVTLSPGIAAEVNNASEIGRGTTGDSAGNFRTHGAFGRDNSFQMNGLPINDLQASGGFSGGVAVPNPDAIQEFKVQTGQYDASYGRNAGANTNVVTKSGGNKFHGTVFEFFRNDALNANSFFNNSTGQKRGILKQNQFGFALGGPLPIFNFGEGGPMFHSGKDKLSFFGSYQGTRQLNGVGGGGSATFFSPPLTNDRSRTALGALFNSCGPTDAGCSTFAQQIGFGGVGVLPNGSNISAPAFALLNMRLPNGQFLIPTPQTINLSQPFALRGFSSFSRPASFNENQFVINLDYLHSENSKIAGRFFYANSDQSLPFAGSQINGAPNVPGFPVLTGNRLRNFSVAHTYTFSPSVVNQLEFGYFRNFVSTLQETVFKFSDIGVAASGAANDFPQIAITGTSAIGGNGQSVNIPQRHFTLQDSLTYIHGRQTFRFGGGITRSHLGIDQFRFLGGLLFQTFPDFLLGLPAGPVASGGNGTPLSNVIASVDIPGLLDRKWILTDGNAFIQDDIKLASSFTLNLGVRYERLGNLGDQFGRNSGFDIAAANPNPPAAGTIQGYVVSNNFPGTVPSGVTQVDNTFGNRGKHQNNFGPRLGFAWKLPNTFLPFTDRMVLRGGYGIYYTRATGQPFIQLAAAPPFARQRVVQLFDNGAASFTNPFQPPLSFPQFPSYSPTTALGISFVDQDYRPPVTQQFSMNLQTDLGHNFLLEVGYVGAKGTHQVVAHSLNQAGLASSSNPIRGITTNTVANVRNRVPILGFTAGGLNDIDSTASSRYDGLEASLTKRFSKGLQFLASYTFAHAYSDAATNTFASGFGNSGNQSDLSGNYGRSEFNREHRFILSYVYQMPGPKRFNGLVNNLLGGWSLAGVTTIQSGLPLSFFGTNSNNVFGITADRAQLAAGCTHDQLVTSGSTQSRLGGYFNRTCFSGLTATGGTPTWQVIGSDGVATNFGNSGPGIAFGPGQNNSDIAIIKRTPVGWLGEGGNIEFRTEFFNAFNHPQFNNPNTNVSSPAFGRITGTSVNPRIIQFGLKVNF